MSVLAYFLKANLYIFLFAGCYWLLLRRHTFFGLNRAYLLIATALSLTLPLASLPAPLLEIWSGLGWPGLNGPAPVPSELVLLPASSAVLTPIEQAPVPASPDWTQLGLTVYGSIALCMLIRFAIQVQHLLQLIYRAHRRVYETYTLVEPSDASIPTFSFFRYIILNPSDTYNDLIIQHELVHVRQYHSTDVVGMRLVRILFWACPTLWLRDLLLRQVHEFLADEQAHHPAEYAKFLVDYSFSAQPGLCKQRALTNRFFNASLLKQRIVMLHQKATSRWAMGKYALVVPLVFGLLAITTARENMATLVNQETDNTITVSGRVTGLDGEPLSAANIILVNTDKGTSTNSNGYYSLSDVPASATLAFSHLGYRSDQLFLQAFSQRIQDNQLRLNPRLTPTLQDELPAMGATAAYKAVKPNPAMPIRPPLSSETVNGHALTAVEEPAVFPTGVPGLMQYVAHHLRYPARAKAAGIQGDVYVVFTVLPTGTIGNVQINKHVKRIGGGCEEEAIRVVRQMPRWIPARQNNNSVAVRYQIPIRFALEKTETRSTGHAYPSFFKPTDSPIGDFSTMRDPNYPNQPRLMLTHIQATSFKADTLPPLGTPVIIHAKGPLGSLDGEPLYLLNGIPISADSTKTLNPHTIESLNVIKGVSAMATWGEKARHGVVLITTKKK